MGVKSSYGGVDWNGEVVAVMACWLHLVVCEVETDLEWHGGGEDDDW
jgi:hypothetical protein